MRTIRSNSSLSSSSSSASLLGGVQGNDHDHLLENPKDDTTTQMDSSSPLVNVTTSRPPSTMTAAFYSKQQQPPQEDEGGVKEIQRLQRQLQWLQATVEQIQDELRREQTQNQQLKIQQQQQRPFFVLPSGMARVQRRIGQRMESFFHARTGSEGCRFVGYIRIGYALLFLQHLVGIQADASFLFHPQTGVLSYPLISSSTSSSSSSPWLFLNALLIQGFVQGALFLLGIAPRCQLLGICFFLYQWNQFHPFGSLLLENNSMFPNTSQHHHLQQQEAMLRLWAFFLWFLPLDHLTLWGALKACFHKNIRPSCQSPSNTIAVKNKDQTNNITSSWPMWPFRLWQIYMVLMYGQAAWKKLAFFWDWGNDSFSAIDSANPNQDVPYSSSSWWWWTTLVVVVLEGLCVFTVWSRQTRQLTVIAMILLHIGMEQWTRQCTRNMASSYDKDNTMSWMPVLLSQYLAALGWLSFLVYPKDDTPSDGNQPGDISTSRCPNSNNKPLEKENCRQQQPQRLDSLFIGVLLATFVLTLAPTQYVPFGGYLALPSSSSPPSSGSSFAASHPNATTLLEQQRYRNVWQTLVHTPRRRLVEWLGLQDGLQQLGLGAPPAGWDFFLPTSITSTLPQRTSQPGAVPTKYTAVIRFHPNHNNNNHGKNAMVCPNQDTECLVDEKAINTNNPQQQEQETAGEVIVWWNPKVTSPWKDLYYQYLFQEVLSSKAHGFPKVVAFMEYLLQTHTANQNNDSKEGGIVKMIRPGGNAANPSSSSTSKNHKLQSQHTSEEEEEEEDDDEEEDWLYDDDEEEEDDDDELEYQNETGVILAAQWEHSVLVEEEEEDEDEEIDDDEEEEEEDDTELEQDENDSPQQEDGTTLVISPHNIIESISLVVHWETRNVPHHDRFHSPASELPPRQGTQQQQEEQRGSECLYVLQLPEIGSTEQAADSSNNNNDKKGTSNTAATVFLRHTYDEEKSYSLQSNCVNYNATLDDAYHYRNETKTPSLYLSEQSEKKEAEAENDEYDWDYDDDEDYDYDDEDDDDDDDEDYEDEDEEEGAEAAIEGEEDYEDEDDDEYEYAYDDEEEDEEEEEEEADDSEALTGENDEVEGGEVKDHEVLYQYYSTLLVR